VAATTAYAAEMLITICPYMAKLLTVIALCQAILISVCLHRDKYQAKARQFEDILGLLSPGKGYEEKGKVTFFRILWGIPACSGHLLDADRVKAKFRQRFVNFSAGLFGGRRLMTAFIGFWDFGKKV
jgi:hypothetical protein